MESEGESGKTDRGLIVCVGNYAELIKQAALKPTKSIDMIKIKPLNMAEKVSKMAVASILLFSFASFSYSLESLEDTELSDVSGAGIAIALNDFRYEMAPTSYIEFSHNCSSAIDANCVPDAAAGALRLYGLTISKETTATGLQRNWRGNQTACNSSSAFGGATCAKSDDPIKVLASVYDPILFRVTNEKKAIAGSAVAQSVDAFELVMPKNSDPFKVSMFMAMQAGNTTSAGGLQMQTVLDHIKLSSTSAGCALGTTPGTVCTGLLTATNFRVFSVPTTATIAAKELGMVLDLRFEGSLGFSVRQEINGVVSNNTGCTLSSCKDSLFGSTPAMDGSEGLVFKDVKMNLSLGRSYYQPITFAGDAANPGGFVVEIQRLQSANAADLYDNNRSNISVGSVRMGSGSNPVDLGSINVSSFNIQHLKITTL